MNPRIAQRAILLAAAVSAACSSAGNVPLDRPASLQQNGIERGLIAPLLGGAPGFETRSGAANIIMPQRFHSWIVPDAKKSELLYVSDQGPETVDIYGYPSDKLKGLIAGFKAVALECVDKSGNVFVTDPVASAVFEYAHGSVIPIATLKDPGYEPVSCSIDPTTGNLAVGNYATTGDEQGNVAIYKDAKGKPHDYTAPNINFVFSCAYDGLGNLFVDGQTPGSAFGFAELPKSGTSFKSITLNQPFGTLVGYVAWDGKYVAILDRSASVIYQFTISGRKGKQVGSTSLVGAGNIVQFWIQSPEVIASDGSNLDVGIWNYPSGGTAVKVITGFSQPVGVTISSIKI